MATYLHRPICRHASIQGATSHKTSTKCKGQTVTVTHGLVKGQTSTKRKGCGAPTNAGCIETEGWLQQFFLPRWLAFLLTTLPRLFFMRSDAFKPPTVCLRLPLKTMNLANFPLPTMDTRFFIAFIAFIAFITFIAFMGFAVITFVAFIAFMAFMAFIAFAISQGSRQKADKLQLLERP